MIVYLLVNRSTYDNYSEIEKTIIINRNLVKELDPRTIDSVDYYLFKGNLDQCLECKLQESRFYNIDEIKIILS